MNRFRLHQLFKCPIPQEVNGGIDSSGYEQGSVAAKRTKTEYAICSLRREKHLLRKNVEREIEFEIDILFSDFFSFPLSLEIPEDSPYYCG